MSRLSSRQSVPRQVEYELQIRAGDVIIGRIAGSRSSRASSRSTSFLRLFRELGFFKALAQHLHFGFSSILFAEFLLNCAQLLAQASTRAAPSHLVARR